MRWLWRNVFGRGGQSKPSGGYEGPEQPCANSFSADTDVTTPGGSEDIEDIKVGDVVLAYNEQTRSTGRYEVVDTISHRDPVVVNLTVGGERLVTTDEHPFCVEGKGVSRLVNLLVPAVLACIALALYLTRLDTPPVYLYDESYHAYTASQYAAGNPDAFVWDTIAPAPGVAYTWNHPPVGLLLISLGIRALGDGPLGWRVMSALFGAAGISLAYVLGRTLARSSLVGLFTSVLLLLDGLYFVQSRTAMLDVFGTVFTLGGLLAFYLHLTSPARRAPLLLTGLLMGLAVATKWNALYPSALVLLVVVWRWRSDSTGSDLRTRWAPMALVALPLTVYLAAYLPFFLAGHGVVDFLDQQARMLTYHMGLQDTHPYQSRWWSWPLMLRPVLYIAGSAEAQVARLYAFGNPWLYWAFLPAVALVAWQWKRATHPALLVLLIGFFGQWLPWMLVPRSTFVYHFLPAVPWGCLAVAMVLTRLWWWSRGGKVVVLGYGTVLIGAFAFFYPVWSALPLTRPELAMRMWLDSWR